MPDHCAARASCTGKCIGALIHLRSWPLQLLAATYTAGPAPSHCNTIAYVQTLPAVSTVCTARPLHNLGGKGSMLCRPTS